MIFTMTSPTSHQWLKVVKVGGWVGVSAVLAIITAYVAGSPKWLATMPGWNVLGVIVAQFLTQEEDQVLEKVPASILPKVESVDTTLANRPVTIDPRTNVSAQS